MPNLVLIGGGHSHTVAIELWNQWPLTRPKANIFLITPTPKTVYSGAIPGYLSGHWARTDCELETVKLAARSGITVILDDVTGLNLEQHQIICRNNSPIPFDLSSLNIGSQPQLPQGVTSSDRIIPMKPMDQMLDRLDQYFPPHKRLSIAIVGGGLGGIEVALSLKTRWGNLLDLTVFCRSHLAAQHSVTVQQFFRAELAKRSIQLYEQTPVITASEDSTGVTLEGSDQTYHYDLTLWATAATAPNWLNTSGLTVDDRGFIQVNQSLQSVSHPNIFASGDIANNPIHPIPKAGVFAVRQAKILAQNLARQIQQQPLNSFKAQKQYLSLVSLGDRRAIALSGNNAILRPSLQSSLWLWKRSIDQKFVQNTNY